jgi:anti-sigma factor RsiW
MPMNCPLETPETANLLLDYCSRKLSPENTAIFERHVEMCPACRRFAEGQRAVWSALDSWEAAPVSPDFDARLYSRLETGPTWRERVFGPLRSMSAYRGRLAAAAACLLLLVGVLLERPGKPVAVPAPPETALMDVQPEQVESALDAMDVLSEFSRKARPENPESKL